MKKILIVDDSATAREIVVRVLGPGYDIVKAGDGVEALAKIAETSPDLVLLDLLMPVMDGFGVLENLAAAGSSIYVVVLSADIQKSTRQRVLALGAVDLINKPVNPDILRSLVRGLLDEKKGEP